jgi:hypothetical protein
LTIAFSTLISAFNSLTLSPALCAILLQPHGQRNDLFTRLLDGTVGWFFRGFNYIFGRATAAYTHGVRRLIGVSWLVLAVYLGLIGLTWYSLSECRPVSFRRRTRAIWPSRAIARFRVAGADGCGGGSHQQNRERNARREGVH